MQARLQAADADFEEVADLMTTMNAIIADINSGKIKMHQGYECGECYNSGFRRVPDPQGSVYMGVVRCDRCSYWRLRRERSGGGSFPAC